MFIVVGNWKMNGDLAFAKGYSVELSEFLSGGSDVEVVVCPPVPYLETMSGGSFKKGAQDCYHKERGPFTGDVSPFMLRDVGCEYVILGHSERRFVGETSEQVAGKANCAHKAGLIAIICVGENEGEDRIKILEEQVKNSVPFSANKMNTIIAYEPCWAIGSGKTPTAEEIDTAHKFITQKTGIPVIYGGSVKPENAGKISDIPSVSGLLVGGASLDIEDFKEILISCKKRK